MAEKPSQEQVRATLKRADKAFEVKQQWHAVLSEAYEFGLPSRNLFQRRAQGGTKMDRVFDSTAVNSTIKFANRLQSNLVPPGQRWASLTAGPLVPVQMREELNRFLQQIEMQVFAVMHASHFDLAANELFLDLATGTACMLILEGDDREPVRYITVPIAQIALDGGPMGSVDGVFRRHEIKIRNIAREWTDAEIPAEIERQQRDDPEASVELTEATYFEPDGAAGRYCYQVLWKGSDKAGGEATALVARHYDDHPWIVCRWVKVAGEDWGRGPLLTALPDIKTLNKVKELVLRNAALAIAGVWAAKSDGVLNPNTIRITPGAVIPVADTNNIKPLEWGGRFDVAAMVVEDLQTSIRTALFDNSLPPDTGPVRSPTEILERVKELQQDIGSPFGRLHMELLVPTLQRTLSILFRRGFMQQAIKLSGLTVKVQINSPLARLQAINDVQGVAQWIELTRGLAGPEATLGAARLENLPVWIGEQLGVPKDLIRPKQERDALQRMVGQLVAQQMQAQAANANPQAAVPAAGNPTAEVA